jgi:hypothetical protein
VIAKETLRTQRKKRIWVSAEELKRANPFLEEEGLQIRQVITIPSRLLPQVIVKKHP